MNAKQLIASALFTCMLVVPRYLFFRFDSFFLEMILNVGCFLVGCTIGMLIFRKKNDAAEDTKNEVKKEAPLPPLPEATKTEDYNKYMPK
jgi:hypothetical protein